MNQASLIVQGKDQTGIVAAVGAVLASHGANIVSLDQYSDDPQGGAFFQRTVFSLGNLKAALPHIEKDLRERLDKEFDLAFALRDLSAPTDKSAAEAGLTWRSGQRRSRCHR